MPITDSVGAKREMQNPVKGRTDAEVGTQEFVDCRRSPSSESTLNVTSVSRLGAISQEDKKNRVENAKLGKYVRLSGLPPRPRDGQQTPKEVSSNWTLRGYDSFPCGQPAPFQSRPSPFGINRTTNPSLSAWHSVLGSDRWIFHGQPAPGGQPAPVQPCPPKSKPSK
jgi:hypothetical protein